LMVNLEAEVDIHKEWYHATVVIMKIPDMCRLVLLEVRQIVNQNILEE